MYKTLREKKIEEDTSGKISDVLGLEELKLPTV